MGQGPFVMPILMKKLVLFIGAMMLVLPVHGLNPVSLNRQPQPQPQLQQDLPGQTPEEILGRMDRAMDEAAKEGMALTMEVKVPIMGTMRTRAWMLGEKRRMEGKALGKEFVMWSDGTTGWMYSPGTNEVVIMDMNEGQSESDTDENMRLISGVTEGYDAVLEDETPQVWHFRCTRSKDNRDKESPKRIDVTVCKGSYMLKELKTSMKGITVVMKDVCMGVTEEDVTFDLAKYPDAEVIDKRK